MPAAVIESPFSAGGKAERLEALREWLAKKCPVVERKPGGIFSSGLAALDEAGGVRMGEVTEVVGGLGGGGLLIEALLQEVFRRRCLAALVDGAGSFDPQGLPAAALDRLLWVRCGEARQAVKAADLLMRDGNLSLVLLDLQMLPVRDLQRVPASTWHRFHRLAEQTCAAFIVLVTRPLVEGAPVRVSVRADWTLEALRQPRRVLMEKLDVRVLTRRQFGVEPAAFRRSA